jgi:hypothetical protein
MPNKWHICKEGEAGNKNRQRRDLLVLSELPILPSAGSRSGCFHTSLGCKPRSLIRVSLGWFENSKKCEEGQSNSILLEKLNLYNYRLITMLLANFYNWFFESSRSVKTN